MEAIKECFNNKRSRDFLDEDGYISRQSMLKKSINVSTTEIPNNLNEIVHSLVDSLYELFGLFKIPKARVDQEISKLINKNR